MKRVLLTGATGLIGSCAIKPLLDKQFEVFAVTSNQIPSTDLENLIWKRADLLDKDQTGNLLNEIHPNYLLHFAWHMEHGRIMNAAENLDWVGASLNLLKVFRENGGKRAVMCGSVSEYDPEGEQPFNEYSSALEPDSLYGICKKAVFETASKYAETEGLSFAWGRAFFQFGKNEAPNRLVASVAKSLLMGEKAKTSHGNQIRDYLCADETADAFVALLVSDIEGAVNIASGEPRTLRSIILAIAEILGVNESEIEFGAIKSSSNEPQKLTADISRLRDEVLWIPKQDFTEDLIEIIDWWKSNQRN